MSLLKSQYKKILENLDLSLEELYKLKSQLTPQNICAGPFIKEDKMCPNTTALHIKLDRPIEEREARRLFNSRGVTNFQLRMFYILFDFPAMISDKLFNRSLNTLKEAVQELIAERA